MTYTIHMAKSKTKKKPQTAAADPRMWRVNQRAHKFVDRRKEADRKACRRGSIES